MKQENLVPDTGQETTIQIKAKIATIRKITTNKNEVMAIVTLVNGLDVAVFPRTWLAYGHELEAMSGGQMSPTFTCRYDDNGFYLDNYTMFPRSQEVPEVKLHEVVPAFPNYEKLSEALRRDMRAASDELLKLRKWLSFVWMLLPSDGDELVKCVSQHIDDALAFLDCVEHVKDDFVLDDSEVQS